MASDAAEFDWLVLEEGKKVFPILLNVLKECERKLPPNMRAGQEATMEKFMITNPSSAEVIKCVLSLLGDNIVQAVSHGAIIFGPNKLMDMAYLRLFIEIRDHTVRGICTFIKELTVRYPKTPGHVYKGTVQPESQWKLQQLQDVCNYVRLARQTTEFAMTKVTSGASVSGDQLMMWLDDIFKHLHNAQTALLVPKKRSISDMQHTKALRSFLPPLPNDLVLSFYVNAYKIVCAVYHLQSSQANKPLRYIIHQGECSVPWLNEALILLGLALQRCQDAKTRISTHQRRVLYNPAPEAPVNTTDDSLIVMRV